MRHPHPPHYCVHVCFVRTTRVGPLDRGRATVQYVREACSRDNLCIIEQLLEIIWRSERNRRLSHVSQVNTILACVYVSANVF